MCMVDKACHITSTKYTQFKTKEIKWMKILVCSKCMVSNKCQKRDLTTPKVKVKGQILIFFVNASHPEPFDVATSNFVAEQVT